MDAETRETLEALAAYHSERDIVWRDRLRLAKTPIDVDALTREAEAHDRIADAIRSALAEIDRLHEELGCERSRVVNLVSRITGKPGDTTNEAVGEASREANRLRKAKERLDALDRESEFTHPQPTLDEAQALAVLMQGAAALARSPETRDMAQRMADAVNALKDHGGRARKETIDALTAQVATLNRDRALMHADRIIDAATIADLESRAIPKAWIEKTKNDSRVVTIGLSRGEGWVSDATIVLKSGGIQLFVGDAACATPDTLASALAAAAKESP